MACTKQKRDFTEGKLLPLIISFTIPLMITGIMQLLFNTADTIVVGRWGGETAAEREIAVAAAGSCGSLINLVTLLFLNFSIGVSVLVAQEIGAKRYDEVQKTVHTAVPLALITGGGVMVIACVLARPLLIMLGTDEAVLDQAVLYMVSYCVGLPAKTLYNYCAGVLRSAGDTTRPLCYLFVAGVVNVVVNLVMVLVFHLGALGVGIATAASLWAAAIMVLVHMMRTKEIYHFDIRKMRLDGEKVKGILRIGIPAGIQGTIFSLSHVLYQGAVNSLGTAAMAGKAAASSIDAYTYTVMNAFNTATVTFVGQHKGAEKYGRMKKALLICLLGAFSCGIALGWPSVIFGRSLLGVFVPGNEAAIEAGFEILLVCSGTYFLCGMMEIGGGALRGLGRSLTSTIVALVGTVALRIIWILFIFPLKPSLIMLYLSMPITWGLTLLVYVVLIPLLLRREECALRAREASAAPDAVSVS